MLYKKKEQGETAVLSFFISTSYDMVQTMSSLTLPRSSLLQGGAAACRRSVLRPASERPLINIIIY